MISQRTGINGVNERVLEVFFRGRTGIAPAALFTLKKDPQSASARFSPNTGRLIQDKPVGRKSFVAISLSFSIYLCSLCLSLPAYFDVTCLKSADPHVFGSKLLFVN